MWQVRAKALVVRRRAGIDDAGRRGLIPQRRGLGLVAQLLEALASCRRAIDVADPSGSTRSTRSGYGSDAAH